MRRGFEQRGQFWSTDSRAEFLAPADSPKHKCARVGTAGLPTLFLSSLGVPLYKLRGLAGLLNCLLPCLSSTSPPSFQGKLPKAPGSGAALHVAVAGGEVSGTVPWTLLQLLADALTYTGTSVCFD